MLRTTMTAWWLVLGLGLGSVMAQDPGVEASPPEQEATAGQESPAEPEIEDGDEGLDLDDPEVKAALEKLFGTEWKFTPRIFGGYLSEVDVKGSAAEVTVATTGLGFNAAGPVGRFGRLEFDLGYTMDFYDWDNPSSIASLGAEPFEEVRTLRGRASLLHALAPDWAGYASFDFSMAGAEGADLSDGFSWNALLGAGTRVSDSVLLGGGVYVSQRLERDLLFVPGLVVDWSIDETKNLRWFGPSLEFTWKTSDEVTWRAQARYESRRFRLDDGAPVVNGVVEDVRLPVTVGVKWNAQPGLVVDVYGGIDAYREIRIRNSSGGAPIELETDVGIVVGLSLEWSF